MIERSDANKIKQEKLQRIKNSKEDQKRLSNIRKIAQAKNKNDLMSLSNFRSQDKNNKFTLSPNALLELENPNTVYILGGIHANGITYIHSHNKTWETGLKTATNLMRKMLEELVTEQQNVIQERIQQINQLWNNIFATINYYEKTSGSNIQINNWNDFSQYFNGLDSPGQIGGLQEILQYKIAMSALNNITDWSWRGQDTMKTYTDRLLKMGVITKSQQKNILDGNLQISSVIKPVEKIIKHFKEENRKGFISNEAVTNWLNTLQDDSVTKISYSNSELQKNLKPNAAQLGFITEHALTTSPQFNKFVQDLQERILEAVANNEINIVEDYKTSDAKGVYRVSISGETNQQRGGLSNAINKADLMTILNLGDIHINIPTSVKLSLNIKNINIDNDIVTVSAEDMFSATASAAHIDFDSINTAVGSSAYNTHAQEIKALAHYVYSNAGALPLVDSRSLTMFNNSIIYYLAWLKICIEIYW